MRRGDDAAATSVRQELLDVLGHNARAGFAMVQIGWIDAVALLRAGDDAKALEFLSFLVEVVRGEGMLYPTALYLTVPGHGPDRRG